MKLIKSILFTLALITLFTSCVNKNQTAKKETLGEKSNIKIQKIASEVDHGLHKVAINDTTVVLIYRGVESCTMIQIK
jgi:hypothetical protein